MEVSPALIKTATWDVVAWNRAATFILTDYDTLQANQRNVLRLMFFDPRVREAQLDWEDVARFVVSAFRGDLARAGASANVSALVEELCQTSPEFAAMWQESEVRTYGGGLKQLRHPQAGAIAFEYSAFAVDGRPDLSMIVYNPATPEDADRVRTLMSAAGAGR